MLRTTANRSFERALPRLVLLTFIFCSLVLRAPNAKAAFHHDGVLSSLSVGAVYANLIERRGVIFYNDFQLVPLVTVFMFDDRLAFLGDSFDYHDFIYGDKIRLRTRLTSISGTPFFPSRASIRAEGPERASTYEWANGVEVYLPGYNDQFKTEIDFSYSKDISLSHGDYLDLTAKFKVASFNLFNKEIEPNLVGSLGWGDSAHNQYYYGPSDQTNGLTNYSFGVWLIFPHDADRFYPIIQVMHFSTIGASQANGEYSRGRNQGLLFSLLAAVDVVPWFR